MLWWNIHEYDLDSNGALVNHEGVVQGYIGSDGVITNPEGVVQGYINSDGNIFSTDDVLQVNVSEYGEITSNGVLQGTFESWKNPLK